MNKGCKLISEDLFCFIELAALPAAHFIYLLQRQECKHPDAFEHIIVTDVSPVLIKLIGTCLVRIKPDCIAGSLSHFIALRVCKERYRHSMGVFAEFFTDQLSAAEHIAPLIITAELHLAPVMLEKIIEVIALHDHVVELKKAQALFHPLLVALGTKHVIN